MKKIKFILASFAIAIVASCSFENDDPNRIPEEAIRPDQMLPGAMVMTYRVQARTMHLFGNRLMQNWYGNINGVTGFDTAPEYTLNIDNDFYSSIWDGIYRGVNNFRKVQDYDSPNYDNHKAIAKIMEAFYMQTIVDLYGDCPYEEAFQGNENITPTYTDDAVVYKALMTQLNEAIALIENADADDEVVGSEDVMLDGDMNQWINFANLVKVRMLLRQSSVASEAGYIQDEFDNIYNTYGVPTASAININPGYSDAITEQLNPSYYLFYNLAGNLFSYGQQATPSGYIADFMNGNLPATGAGVVDPRREYLYELKNGEVLAAYQGEITEDGYQGVVFSKVNALFSSPSSDGIVMSLPEAHFLLSEAYLQGYFPGGDSAAQSAFNSGVEASFDFLGASDYATYATAIDAVAGSGWNGGNKLEAIMTQKWIAVNGVNPTESFIDHVRTGYPDLPLATTAIYPHRPYRLMYPLSEYVANSANVPNLSQADLFSQGPFWKN